MQVKNQEVSADKATTPGRRTRPTLASHRLDLPSICDICGKPRSTGKHAKCSRTRQQTKQAEWSAFMAELAAKRLAKQERRRYGR
ncbi:hypothetical protein [Ectopseudomonas mendocina]|uniref:Uncharacterized protein n=1 Tax=Ectopseudomonas mendocina TaxID=300 RepID=A0A2R3QVI3_ECTME|nr:hypothetical protein [Pseudomonas mendocina]AVO55767.1 hypothetical protein C7A17_24450 [Pseudomonas mendocina]